MADSEDDLPESISFSASKSQAIKDFQLSVKKGISKKRRVKRQNNNDEETQIQRKPKKERLPKPTFEESETSISDDNIRIIEAGTTVFQIETIDDNLSKAHKMSDKAIEFRRKQLSKRSIERQTAKSWLSQRIKVATRTSTQCKAIGRQ